MADIQQSVVVWVHSGGTDPVTGEPTYASKLRLEKALEMLANLDSYECDNRYLLLSGEETRKSGQRSQGEKLLDWCNREPRFAPYRLRAVGASMKETYRQLAAGEAGIAEVWFINDDVHISRYAYDFAEADAAFYRKMQLVPVPVLGNSLYREKYPMAYMACYNALAWLRSALRQVGLGQFVLFGVDRTLNKPSHNPLKRAAVAVVNRFIRADLRG